MSSMANILIRNLDDRHPGRFGQPFYSIEGADRAGPPSS
jgi:hypothetical protein